MVHKAEEMSSAQIAVDHLERLQKENESKTELIAELEAKLLDSEMMIRALEVKHIPPAYEIAIS